MTPNRRDFLKTTLAGGVAALAVSTLLPGAARALEVDQARSFIEKVVAEITTLIQSGKSADAQRAEFSEIFRRNAAVPQITRFVMGQTWRDMSDAQKAKAEDALVSYVGRVYAGLLSDYQGQTLEVVAAKDFGGKGVLVTSRAKGAKVDDSTVEWQVSDRGGKVQVVDVVAEGVSLLQTQRQEFAAMIDKRNGDVDRFLDDLAAGRVAEG
ncbi:ABC transporter substrate-binding protein [Albimonas sp. CAU 1670]|uniref:MlaC/ttg2D family ABC transporter substrate-binding protein n=1 Tax=Albimonas sp. CAU 1670 TaxID=3032599 RepID=UPI0023DC4453|nr:ABC transporter substrate-binding protein [Albimonas sp. CAU 1670]MDF2233534.1 ABC transporter substrate-binding protein [Albimonas sp. CAU 1670]